MTIIDGHGRSCEATGAVIQPPGLDARSDLVFDDTNLLLSFTVSRDEEHVDLRVAYRGEEWNLGERVHHYPLLLLVRLRTQAGASALLARVTRRSAQALALAPGQAVWAMVKSVALLD